MTSRPSHRALIAVTMLALWPVTPIHAQNADVDLRAVSGSGDFPTSPTNAPSVSPDDNAPAILAASPTTADIQTPADTATGPASTSVDDDGASPNYGKRRKKKPKLYRPDPRVSPPLPGLVPYRGAPGPQRKALNPVAPSADAVDPLQPAPTIAVIPSPVRIRPPLVDADPFAPTGVRVGNLRLLPFVETSTGYESNPNQVNTGVKASSVLRVDGGLDVASDLPNHSITGSLRGGYSDFPSNRDANRPNLSGVLDGRLDVTRNDQINAEARLTVATQTPGSPLLAVPNSVYITGRPTIVAEGATLGGTHVFNRLALTLRGTVDRVQYGDATQSDGTIFQYSHDNYNDYGIVGRASYELTPAIIPFAEVGYDTRVRDNAADLSGYYRDSVGITGKAGSSFEFTRLLTGTASVGYADRTYADPRLPNLRGPTADGSLVYRATPLTTITATAVTTLAETTLAGASGAISRNVSLQIDHVFFRHFVLSGIATYQPNEYEGVSVHEAFTQFTLKGTYNFSREIALIGSASRQSLTSSIAGSSFDDKIFLLGVRLQR